jgi:hypothetical protein
MSAYLSKAEVRLTSASCHERSFPKPAISIRQQQSPFQPRCRSASTRTSRRAISLSRRRTRASRLRKCPPLGSSMPESASEYRRIFSKNQFIFLPRLSDTLRSALFSCSGNDGKSLRLRALQCLIFLIDDLRLDPEPRRIERRKEEQDQHRADRRATDQRVGH